MTATSTHRRRTRGVRGLGVPRTPGGSAERGVSGVGEVAGVIGASAPAGAARVSDWSHRAAARSRPRIWSDLAADPAGSYHPQLPVDVPHPADSVTGPRGRTEGGVDTTAGPADALAADTAAARAVEAELADVVERLTAMSPDELDEDGISSQLGAVDLAMRRLDARRCRLAASLTDRRSTRAREQARQRGEDDDRAGERARREAERDLADQHRWSPTDAKRAVRTGEQLSGDDAEVQTAFDTGALPPRHAQLLADTLRHLEGEDRERASQTLLAAAAEQNARTFGRTCRRMLAQLDAAAAREAENRRYDRRRAAVATTDDGMLSLSGQWSGIDAETIATAVDAFRSPDPTGISRNAEQRTADAVVELARAALRSGDAPSVHGIRPHVTVTIGQDALRAGRSGAPCGDGCEAAADCGRDASGECDRDVSGGNGLDALPCSGPDAKDSDGQDVRRTGCRCRGGSGAGDAATAGVAETPWMGPLPFDEVRRLLADAGVSRLLLDADGAPIEAGEPVRTVPAGLWRSLAARDGGCIADGCDAPANWCDVMHLDQPYRLEGRLTIDTAGLGCRHHHRALDLYGWQVVWNRRRPRLRPPPT